MVILPPDTERTSWALTGLVVGEVEDLHPVWVGDVCGLGVGVVVDLSTRDRAMIRDLNVG